MVKIDSLYIIYFPHPSTFFSNNRWYYTSNNTNPKEENDYDTELLCKYFSDEFINKV